MIRVQWLLNGCDLLPGAQGCRVLAKRCGSPLPWMPDGEILNVYSL